MITALDDLSVLQNHDGVGVPHGGETVGDHEGGPFCHQTVHALLDVLFRSRIDGARRFIEDQDLRVSQDGSGDREELFLTLGYVAGFFVENHVVSAWKSLDETMYVGSFGCCYDFFVGGIEFSIFDIIFDASAEQPGILKYHSEHLSEFAPVEVFDVCLLYTSDAADE